MQNDCGSGYDLAQALALRTAPGDEIDREQMARLRSHLRWAQRIPFYRQRLAPEEIDAVTSPVDLARLPLTSREDLDRTPHLFGLDDPETIRDIAITSGTTGTPVVVPYTENDLVRLAFNEAVAYYSAGCRPGDRVLLTVTLDRCFIAGLAYYSGVRLAGGTAIRSGPGQPARQWELIHRLHPTFVVGVPTFLVEVGEWGRKNGIDVSRCSVRKIVTIGEPARRPDFSPTGLGARLMELWGAEIYSSYGATEFETAFGECSAGRGGHVHPELMVVEIIDDNGNILPNGRPGEVVVTPLGVQGFPLVRFRTGDIARLYQEPCACGWHTQRLGPVEGRLSQRLKCRGTTLYPETIFHALQEMDSVTAAYVEVRKAADGADDVTVVVGCIDTSQDTAAIEERLQAHLRFRPKVVLSDRAEVAAVMGGEGGRKPKKFFDFRS